jgi:hypothetical protein
MVTPDSEWYAQLLAQIAAKKHGPIYTHFMGIFTPVLFPKMNLITKNETVNRDGTTFRRVF